MISIGERLGQFIQHLGEKPSVFDKRVGLSNGMTGKIIANKTSFTMETAEKIISKNRSLNVDWLITGEGKMLQDRNSPNDDVRNDVRNDVRKQPKGKTNSTFLEDGNSPNDDAGNHAGNDAGKQPKGKTNSIFLEDKKSANEDVENRVENYVGNSPKGKTNSTFLEGEKGRPEAPIKNEHIASSVQPIVVTVDNKGRDNIVMVEAKAAAGYAQHFYEPSFYSDLPTFSLPGQEFRNRTFRCFEVNGDSMENTLFDGDWVIASYCDPWPISIREGYIYVIVTNETIYIKRILDRLNDYGKLVLLSDNESVIPKDLDGEEVRELWYVKAKLSFKLPNLRQDISRKVYNLEADMLEVKKQLSDLLKRGNL